MTYEAFTRKLKVGDLSQNEVCDRKSCFFITRQCQCHTSIERDRREDRKKNAKNDSLRVKCNLSRLWLLAELGAQYDSDKMTTAEFGWQSEVAEREF